MAEGAEGPDLIGNIDRYRTSSPSFGISNASESRAAKIEGARRHSTCEECWRRWVADGSYPRKAISTYLPGDSEGHHPFWLMLSDKLYQSRLLHRSEVEHKDVGALSNDDGLGRKIKHPLLARVVGITAVSFSEQEVFIKPQHPEHFATVRAIKLDREQDIRTVLRHWNVEEMFDWDVLEVKQEDVRFESRMDPNTVELHITSFGYYRISPLWFMKSPPKICEFFRLYFISDSYNTLLNWPSLDSHGSLIYGRDHPSYVSRTQDARARAFIVHKWGYSTTVPQRKRSLFKRTKKFESIDIFHQNNIHIWMAPNSKLEDRDDYLYGISPTYDWVVSGRVIHVYTREEENRLLQAVGADFIKSTGFVSIDGDVINKYGHYSGNKRQAEILCLKQPVLPQQDGWAWSSQHTSTKSLDTFRYGGHNAFRDNPFVPSFFFLYESYPDTDPHGQPSRARAKASEILLRQTFAQLLGLDLNSPTLQSCTLPDFEMSLYPSQHWSHPSDAHANILTRHAHIYPSRGAFVRGLALWVETEAIADAIQSYFPRSITICKHMVEIELDEAVVGIGADTGAQSRSQLSRIIHPHTSRGCLLDKFRRGDACYKYDV